MYLESEKNQFQREINILDQLLDQKFEESIILPNIQLSASESEPEIEPAAEINAKVVIENEDKVKKKSPQIKSLPSAFSDRKKSTKVVPLKPNKQIKSPRRKIIKKKHANKESSAVSESSSESSVFSEDSAWDPDDDKDAEFIKEEKLREKAFHDRISRKKSVISATDDHQKLIGIDSIVYQGDLKYIKNIRRKKFSMKNEVLNYVEGMVLPNSNALPEILPNFNGKRLTMNENIFTNPKVDELYEQEGTQVKKNFTFDISQIKKKINEENSSPEPEIMNLEDFDLSPTKSQPATVDSNSSYIKKPFISRAEILTEIDEDLLAFNEEMTVDLNEDITEFPEINQISTPTIEAPFQKKKRASKVKRVIKKHVEKPQIESHVVKEDIVQESPKIVVRKGSKITETIMKMHGLKSSVEYPADTSEPLPLRKKQPSLLVETNTVSVKRSVDSSIPEEQKYDPPPTNCSRTVSTLKQPAIINLDGQRKKTTANKEKLNASPIIEILTALGIIDNQKIFNEQPRVILINRNFL